MPVTFSFNFSSGVEDLGHGFWGHKEATITVTPGPKDDLPTAARLELSVANGRYVVTSIHADEITSDLLRKLAIAGLVRGAAYRALWVPDDGSRPDGSVKLAIGPGDSLMRYAPPSPDVAQHGPTDEALRAVAVLYRVAIIFGGSAPTNEVAEHLKLTRPTAGRWVMKAREKGYLEPVDNSERGA